MDRITLEPTLMEPSMVPHGKGRLQALNMHTRLVWKNTRDEHTSLFCYTKEKKFHNIDSGAQPNGT